MGFDRKDIQVCAWNILKFSVETIFSRVKKYPLGSCILFLFFLLYMFFPTVFTFLIYSLPLVGFAALVHRVFVDIHRQKVISAKEDEKRINDGTSYRNLRSVEDDQPAKRRNAKEKKGNEKFTYLSVQDKDAVFSASFNNDLVDKSALIEEKPKEIREVKVESVIDRGECSSSNADDGYQKYGNNGKVEAEGESFDNSEEEDEEEAQEERNKAVEWTEDDQKNLMDLGLSEIERNKRLESLIARRRSRKMLSFQVRRTIGSNNNNFLGHNTPSLQIPKSNPFLANGPSNQFSPGPGSAPSILLPMRNPFDLPYDPYEEKPNLTGDSFHQEFMAAHQKEMMFCRHESFSTKFAFLPPELMHDKHEMSFYNGFVPKHRTFSTPEASRIDKEHDDKEIQQAVPTISTSGIACDHAKQEGESSEQVVSVVGVHKEEDGTEGQTKEMVVDVSSGRSSLSSSSDGNEPIFRSNKDAILNSLSFAARRNIATDREDNFQTEGQLYDSGPSTFDKTRAEEHFLKGLRHTPSHSIASDLQVEVSEVGSPPLTNISSQDEESSINDGEMEKHSTYGCEETWAVTSHLSGVDERESSSRGVQEVREKDIIEVGFSRMNHTPENLASDMLPEKIVEQDTTDSCLLSPSETDLPESIGPNETIHEIARSPRVPDSFEAILTEKTLGSHDEDSGKPEELSTPTEKFNGELKTLDSENDPENSTTVADVALTLQENAMDLSILSEDANSKSTETRYQLEKQIECNDTLESYKLDEDKDLSYSSEDFVEEANHLSQHKDVFQNSASTENDSVSIPTQDSEVEQDLSNQASSSNLDSEMHTEVQTSISEMVQSNHLDEQNMLEGELGVEQLVIISSSPKFVLQPEFSRDGTYLSNFGEEIHSEVQQSDREIGERDSLHLLLPENLAQAARLDMVHHTDNSIQDRELMNLQPEFSIDGTSLSNFGEEIHCEVQQPDSGIGESDSLHQLPPENLTQAAPLDMVHHTDNSIQDSDLANLQPEFSIDGTSLSNFGEEIHCEVQQPDSGIGESDSLHQLPPENLTQAAPLDMVHHTDNSIQDSDLANLQPEFSIDGTSLSNFGEEIHCEVQQPDSGIGESDSLHQLPPENLTQAAPLDMVHHTDNSIQDSDLANLQPEFSIDGTSLSNFGEEIHCEVQQPDSGIGESDSLHQLPPENLTQAAPLDMVHHTDNSIQDSDLANLQPEFSIDGTSLSNFGEEIHCEVQQPDSGIGESDSLHQLPPENLTQAAPLDMVHHTDNSIQDSDLANLQPEFSIDGTSLSNFGEEIHCEVQHPDSGIGESDSLHQLPPENLTQAAPLDMVHHTDNSIQDSDLANLQEQSDPPPDRSMEESTTILNVNDLSSIEMHDQDSKSIVGDTENESKV